LSGGWGWGQWFIDFCFVGAGLGKVEGGKEEEQEAYMRLTITVLTGLARVPEVAADEGVISTVPLVAEVVAKS
jgi:hypothetical protein